MVERMTQLTMGLLIHDIGKISIPESDPQQAREADRRRMGADQDPPCRRRVDALLRSHLPPHPQHRPRSPRALGRPRLPGRSPGDDTHQFARIAAVADVYDAITADRPYQPATAPHVGVKVVREGAGTQFDEQIVEHFLRIAMPYPVGYTITLPDGTPGAVAGVDPEEPEYPVIRYRNETAS